MAKLTELQMLQKRFPEATITTNGIHYFMTTPGMIPGKVFRFYWNPFDTSTNEGFQHAKQIYNSYLAKKYLKNLSEKA